MSMIPLVHTDQLRSFGMVRYDSRAFPYSLWQCLYSLELLHFRSLVDNLVDFYNKLLKSRFWQLGRMMKKKKKHPHFLNSKFHPIVTALHAN